MMRIIKLIKPFAGYLLVATALMMIILSSIPSIPTLKIKAGNSTIRLDYFIHFCEYGFLAFISFLTFSGKEYEVPFKRALTIVLSLVVFAFLDEFHQKLIPGRSYNILDFASNSLGVIGGWVFSEAVFRWIRKTEFNNDSFKD